MKVLQIISLLFILSGLSFAQNKIAVVDTGMFEDENLGIKEFVFAKKKIAEEFKDSIDKILIEIDEFKKITKEIEEINKSKFFCTPNLLSEKVDKASELQKELQAKTDAINLQIEKRKSEIVEPVKKRITGKLKEFAKLKNHSMIIDLAQTIESSGIICIFDDKTNVTKEFIKFCNQEFEKEKLQK